MAKVFPCGTACTLRLIVLLLIVVPALVVPADAIICWGKACGDAAARIGLSAACCSGHGTCVGLNQCSCNDGWEGKDCSNISYCGSCLDYSCSAGQCSVNFTISSSTTAPYTINGVSMSDTAAEAIMDSAYCNCPENRTGLCCNVIRPVIVRPASLDFGNASVGSTAMAQTPVTFTNPLVKGNMMISSVALDGTNPSDFAYTTTSCSAGTTLTGSGSCSANITFTPSATGTRTANLKVVTMDPDHTSDVQTLSVMLTGTGTTQVTSVLVDPNSASTVFAGVDGAGIYKSTNSGSSWTAATIPSVSTRIKALVIKNTDSTKLYAATYGGGVYQSTDSGASWSACTDSGLGSSDVLSLVANSTGTLYAGTDAGIYTSSDSCASWTALNNGLPAEGRGDGTQKVPGICVDPGSTAAYGARGAGLGR